ncbi:hypothetical protein [Paeniglutamicibacter gangotriensis]|uniref:Tetratricopeptide repeat protein n=1 Tax=Paeniglutamicibacter gangotriensis Lz1y TaxID=1276920 RepID=M7MVW8_9MICC|nr:hypothetical protein [Paeniglutamicibacter gangotriensis]EMQ99196.1 hypothetical protein ADIAG_01186 [Paeniglutamicibacter gangotriensis Lz1y]
MSDWTNITAAISVALNGEKDRGQELLLECWDASGPGDHAPRCIPAHSLADTQTELKKEVAWDQTALDEHGFLADDDLAPLGIASALGMQPSLQLNLADGYHRQGRIALAREHLNQGLAHADALHNDGYGKMILAGLNNLAQRIGASESD